MRQVMLPVWSSYYFFTLYANAANGGAGFDARQLRADEVAGLPEMDRYLLARTRRLVERVEKSLDEFAISDACDAASDFIDVLTNWYIRNTRDRFWKEDANAFNTLYTVLEVFMRVLAPLAPMESESVWRGLTGGESVHLADWPYVADEKTGEATELGRVLVDDPALVDAMEKVREIVSGTLSLRKAAQIRVRQPLAKLTVVVEDVDAVKAYDEILKSELNIKDIEFCTMEDAGSQGLKIVHELKVNARAAGPRLGKQVQFAIKASKTGAWHVDAATGAPVVETPNDEVALGGRRIRVNQPRGGGERRRGRRFRVGRSAHRRFRDSRYRADRRPGGRGLRPRRDSRRAGRPQGRRPGHRRSHRPSADRAVRQCGRCRAVPRSDRP